MRISFIIPSRNNLIYLKQAVSSIQECYGDSHDIVLLDDASTDGTWNWIESLRGENIIKYRNNTTERVGHTILYDKGVELSRTEAFTIFHADMVTTPNHIPNMLKHLKKGTVVSATRIEPPLHPPGPEKYVRMYGFEPKDFKKSELLSEVVNLESINKDKTTNGIFAPWCMYKEDFQAIGGHDPLFAPMELEDSDIFNRMYLAGYKLLQARDSFVYHMTCRGSRFKDGIEIEAEIPLPDGTIWYKPKDSEEYKALRAIKFREWWRKWGSNVLHDEFLMPIVRPKYNIAIVLNHSTPQLLEALEPWCDRIYTDDLFDYVEVEQKRSKYDISKRVLPLINVNPFKDNDIIVEIEGSKFTNATYDIIRHLPEIIKESGDIGKFELGEDLIVTINRIEELQKNLINNVQR